jgi:hypothetical protein
MSEWVFSGCHELVTSQKGSFMFPVYDGSDLLAGNEVGTLLPGRDPGSWGSNVYEKRTAIISSSVFMTF